VAELGLGSALTPTGRAVRGERSAAAVAEPCARPIRLPALVTVHGDTPSTPGRLRWFTFRVSDTTRRARGPSLRTIGAGPFCRLIVSEETQRRYQSENLLVMTRRSPVVQSPIRLALHCARQPGSRSRTDHRSRWAGPRTRRRSERRRGSAQAGPVTSPPPGRGVRIQAGRARHPCAA